MGSAHGSAAQTLSFIHRRSACMKMVSHMMAIYIHAHAGGQVVASSSAREGGVCGRGKINTKPPLKRTSKQRHTRFGIVLFNNNVQQLHSTSSIVLNKTNVYHIRLNYNKTRN